MVLGQRFKLHLSLVNTFKYSRIGLLPNEYLLGYFSNAAQQTTSKFSGFKSLFIAQILQFGWGLLGQLISVPYDSWGTSGTRRFTPKMAHSHVGKLLMATSWELSAQDFHSFPSFQSESLHVAAWASL